MGPSSACTPASSEDRLCARGWSSVFRSVKPLTRFAAEEMDGEWASKAARMTPGQLWTEARRRERITRQQVREESKLRYLWMGWDDDKRVLHVEADVPGEQGAAFEAKLRRRSEEIVVEDGVMDREGARLCDALVELVCESGGSDDDVVVVHADVAVLTGA